ncbi:MAG: tRNA-intron lyase [Nitrososphaeria archaeon]
MFTGHILGNRIVVWDINESRELYRLGFYGKPLGIHKPKNFDFQAPLILDLIEGLYLVEKNFLRVLDKNGKEVPYKALFKICEKDYVDFGRKYAVYKDLREKNYIVLPGIKFGCDFAVYEKGPGIDHAPYIVHVVKDTDKLSATYLVLSGRLATTVRKRFIIAIADGVCPKYLAFEWWKG